MKPVEIKGLRYTYPDGRPALNGVDFVVEEGESVGLIGPNGAGKTTLLLHLNATFRGEGEVRILGVDVKRGNPGDIRGRVGLVFQEADAQLFCPTVYEDVAFGPQNMGLGPEEVHKRVHRALDQVGLGGEFEERAPHHLSIGEQRLASLATVLSMSPEMLVLDEPGANLDPRSRRGMLALLGTLSITKVVASHDLDLVRRLCSRVVLLGGGRIRADGPAAGILDDEALLREAGL